MGRKFKDDSGKAGVEASEVVPDEWKGDLFKNALTYNGPANFHREGIVYAVDMIVAVPAKA